MNNAIRGAVNVSTLILDQTGYVRRTTGKSEKEVVYIVSSGPPDNFEEMERDLEHVSVVDRNKVNRIRQKIADGSYVVDAEKIAEKLLETEKLLDR